MINCIAIDKDGEALAELRSHIEKIPFLSLIGTYSNPFDANALLARKSVDLIFADPDMDPINGIDFIKSLVHNPLVVFITNNPDYAVGAYDAGVLDYIVKPLTLERLIRVASKAYVVCGVNNGSYITDFWQFDPSTEAWAEMREIAKTLTPPLQRMNYIRPGSGYKASQDCITC